jgi:hypothetical protein
VLALASASVVGSVIGAGVGGPCFCELFGKGIDKREGGDELAVDRRQFLG